MPEPRPLRPNDPREVGGFRLTARIGEGAQGSVYLGESGTGERVAVKLLHADVGRDARARTLFERELAAVRRVAPFCTARVLAAEADDDAPYIVSEYIDGPSLRELVAERGAVSGVELTRLAIGTVTALAAIHEAGVVHRDFKPANVLLGPDGPKVIDFGIARPLDATSATMTGAVGTPAYMAPEQVAGAAGGAPLDMFAWGCTMAFAANGVPPFGHDSVPAIMQRVLYGEPELGALTGELRALVADCLAKEPAGRMTALQVLQRLLGAETDAHANLLAEGTSAAAEPSATPPVVPAAPPPIPPPTAYPQFPPAVPPPLPPPGTFPPPSNPTDPGRNNARPVLIATAITAVFALVVGGIVTAILLRDRDGRSGSASSGTPVAQSGRNGTSNGAGAGPCKYLPETGEATKDVGMPPSQPSADPPTTATIETNLGAIRLRLDTAKAPCTVNSLSYLASKKFYNDTSCHRLTTSRSLKVLQCGDPTGTGGGGPSYRFANENTNGARYPRGTIAMANRGANTDSNGSQFFIVYGDATLPPDYTPFGQVTSGIDLVDKVAEKGVEGGKEDGKPEQTVTITEFRMT